MLENFLIYLCSLQSFATDWRQAQRDKDKDLRRILAGERTVLIVNGKLSEALTTVLTNIFDSYAVDSITPTSLQYTAAARLFYRCGLKLAYLQQLMDDKDHHKIVVEDFVAIFSTIAKEDETMVTKISFTERKDVVVCQIGDRVELIEGYDKYGDALGGPLQPRERGVVVDVQNGSKGERYV
jgi:hypothetical protein